MPHNRRQEIGSPLPQVLYYNDQDFQTLVTLSEKLLRHAATMLLMLTDDNSPQQSTPRTTKASNLLDLLPNVFTTADAVLIGEELGISIFL